MAQVRRHILGLNFVFRNAIFEESWGLQKDFAADRLGKCCLWAEQRDNKNHFLNTVSD